MKKLQKRYVVRKLVMADSVIDAVRKEKSHSPESVFIDEDWQKIYDEELKKSIIGFKHD